MVWLYADDADGNVDSCQATITITSAPPAADCQDVSVTLDGAGSASIGTTDVDNGSTSACVPIDSFALSTSTLGCADLPSTVVTMTVYAGGL